MVEKKIFVTQPLLPDIEDVNAIAVATLRHRIVLNYEAQANGYTTETIIKELINIK